MKNITKRLHTKRIILVLIIILWMYVVFYLSSQNGNESQGTSSFIVNIVASIYTKLTNIQLTMSNIDNLTYVIRKIAHFTLYFLGSISVFLLFKTYNISKRRTYIYTLLFCVIYACSDEFHQIFSKDRNGNCIDILIDTFGSALGMIFVDIVSNIVYKLKE